MNIPKPTDPVPIYGGKVEAIELYIDGVKQTLCVEPLYGEFDVKTGIVTYYGMKDDEKGEEE